MYPAELALVRDRAKGGFCATKDWMVDAVGVHVGFRNGGK